MSTVNFTSDGETLNESNGAFTIPVRLSSPPSGTPKVNTVPGVFTNPAAVAVDTAGNVYVANDGDGNPGDGTVSVVLSDGMVRPFATGLNDPHGLAIDAAGNLYASDPGDGTVDKVPAEAGWLRPSPRGWAIPPAWPSTPSATSTSPMPSATR